MSMISSLGHHAEVGIPPVGVQPAPIDRKAHRVHLLGVIPVFAAAGFAAVLLMQAVAAPVHVGPGLDLTQPQPVVGNLLANGGALNCDTVGNCLTP
jgi:hypothetical protein